MRNFSWMSFILGGVVLYALMNGKELMAKLMPSKSDQPSGANNKK